MVKLNSPRLNHLLEALPEEEYEYLLPHLELVQLKVGDVLYESGEKLQFAYFPATCIISLLYIVENGGTSEVAVIGNEGVIGVALFMDSGRMPNLAVVLSTGYAYRLRAQQFVQEFNRNGTLHHLLLRFTQALIIQMGQIAVCNRHHSIDQQLCHWLLLNHDRVEGNELNMTQEMIASMLGVRREGITEAAGDLQKSGLIKYNRGHITILDRPGLEARACECYQVVKVETDRLLPAHRAASGN